MDLCKHSHIHNYNKYSQKKEAINLRNDRHGRVSIEGYIYIYISRKRDREEREVGSNIIQISLKNLNLRNKIKTFFTHKNK